MPLTALPSADLPVGTPVTVRAPVCANGTHDRSLWCSSAPRFPTDIAGGGTGQYANVVTVCLNRIGPHVIRCDVTRPPPPGEPAAGTGQIVVMWHPPNQVVRQGFDVAGSGSFPFFVNDLRFYLLWNGQELGSCATGFAQERVTRYSDAAMTVLSPADQTIAWTPAAPGSHPEYHFHSPYIFDRKVTEMDDTPQNQQAFANAAEGSPFPPFVRQEMRIRLSSGRR